MPRIRSGSTPDTLQVFSIKLAEIAGGLQWPLSVYGVVAARDTVDHNRNLIFSCDRSHAQELKQDVRILLPFYFLLQILCLPAFPLLLINGVKLMMVAG